MDPLDCLIEDCWEHVFKFLPAIDKHSLCQTCTSFQAMLEPQKVNWAFELILPHILNGEFRDYWREDESSKLAGFSWRRVCKSWKVGFDNYCTNVSPYNCDINERIRSKYDFCDERVLENFLTVFKEPNGNPLIGRRVKLLATPLGTEAPGNEADGERDAGDDERFQREIRERILNNGRLNKELVIKYGKEIEHLTVSHYYNHQERELCSYLDACKFLQFVLCHTPNLQSFDFPTYGTPGENADLLEPQVTEYFELNPLPKVPRVREMRFLQIHPQIETLILEAYGHSLQSLSTFSSSEISTAVWSNMKCLKKLDLAQSKFNIYEKLLQALRSPSLESLNISEKRESWDKSDKFFEIDKFLLAIQHLPLKIVTVRPALNNLKESAPFPATFPRHHTIESLTLEIPYPDRISLNFITVLPNLKSLTLGSAKIQLDLVIKLLKSCSTTN